MTPLQVLRTPGLALVDIRPVAERYGSVGFVPGSLSIPAVDSPEQTRRMICEAAGDRTPVLVCLSGRRAQHHASCDATQGGELAYLEGGVLAWAASGLPVSGVNLQPSDDAPELADFPRHMAACFVGQLVEVSLDRAESID
ncbi:MAG: rhodanese-like domain-containing protein, partial [Myxococcales bacterium]|nr:rhodanese-like domain-containing protein [Myxococcales bacterium]